MNKFFKLSLLTLLLTISIEQSYGDCLNDQKSKDIALLHAAVNGDVEKAKELIAMNANVNVIGEYSTIYSYETTPIDNASKHGHYEIVKLLIDAGANINTHYTAINFAIKGGHDKIVKLLIDSGANIDTEVLAKTYSIQTAIMFGYYEVLKVLIEANPNLATGQFLFNLATDGSQTKILKLITEKNSKIKKSKLEQAIISGDMAAIKELAHSKIGYWGNCTPDKERALALAVLTRQTEVFNYLCDIWNVPTEPSSAENILRSVLDWVCFLDPTNFYIKYNDDVDKITQSVDQYIRINKLDVANSTTWPKKSKNSAKRLIHTLNKKNIMTPRHIKN